MFNKEPNFDYLNLYQERPLPPLSDDLFSSIKPILTEQTDYSPNPYKMYLFKKQQNFPYDIIHNAETSINEDSYFSNNKSSKLGRKKKGDNRDALHDKSKRDNIMISKDLTLLEKKEAVEFNREFVRDNPKKGFDYSPFLSKHKNILAQNVF